WRFLFSRRRRHTSSKRDWSSDVCSSDLQEVAVDALASRTPLSELESSRAKQRQQTADSSSGTGILVEGSPDILAKLAKCCQPVRSEERRVGKEGRARSWREQREKRASGM